MIGELIAWLGYRDRWRAEIKAQYEAEYQSRIDSFLGGYKESCDRLTSEREAVRFEAETNRRELSDWKVRARRAEAQVVLLTESFKTCERIYSQVEERARQTQEQLVAIQ